jgi:tetratricopeptide (TPR) repeat protein
MSIGNLPQSVHFRDSQMTISCAGILSNWQSWLALLFLVLAAGCSAAPRTAAEDVDDGLVAIGGRRYDVAVEDADEAIHLVPSPQAYYVRARAEEERPKPDSGIASADLAAAKTDYQSALDLHPPQPLEARCRAGLAQVDYDGDDYAGALYQWTTALDNLDQPDWKADALYRIGECQQRLGRFDDADATFARVDREYADQDVATKAQARQGVRGFYVQLATFSNPDDAKAAVKAANSAGAKARMIADNGSLVVRAGPYTTYLEAKRLQQALVQQYPDAFVGP